MKQKNTKKNMKKKPSRRRRTAVAKASARSLKHSLGCGPRDPPDVGCVDIEHPAATGVKAPCLPPVDDPYPPNIDDLCVPDVDDALPNLDDLDLPDVGEADANGSTFREERPTGPDIWDGTWSHDQDVSWPDSEEATSPDSDNGVHPSACPEDGTAAVATVLPDLFRPRLRLLPLDEE